MRRLLPLLVLLPLLDPRQPALADTALRVAVLEFTNASTDPQFDPLGKGLQSMLTTDLASVQALQLVERSRLVEIQAEIDLGRSGAVDAATAVRFGRLAGASHLLAGSFVVVGSGMRLDARLFRVEDGQVQFGEDISGETEAFFELEKRLVDALIRSFGLTLAARERAAVSRIHTADFEAFRSFSLGIDLFDRQDYDRAIERLRDAAARDEDFKLARVTLEEYERLIASLRTRSDELAAARQEMERLERLQAAQGEVRVAQRLFAIAAEEGPTAARRRLTALHSLAVAYANLGTDKGKLHDLRASEDRWGLQRTAEVLARSYWAEAMPLWPQVPPVVDPDFFRDLPGEATFDADFDEAMGWLWDRGSDYPENRRNYLLDSLRYPADMARLLHLDRAQAVELRERLVQAGQELQPGDWWQEEQTKALVEDYRSVLRLDEATALLTRDSAGEQNPYVLEGIAREVEQNRDIQALLDGTANRERMAEWVMLARADGWSQVPIVTQGREHFMGPVPDAHGLALLNDVREDGFDRDEYVLIGDHPAWTLQGGWWLRTGPRSDPLRAESLRYYKPGDATDELETIVLLDGVPRQDVDVSFELGFERPDDWAQPSRMRDLPEEEPWTHGRPALGFLFGVRDVDVEKQETAKGEEELTRPLTAWLVLFAKDEVQLVRQVESERGIWDRKAAFRREVLGSAPVRWPKGRRAKVSIRIDDRGVQVTVDGKAHRFDAPQEWQGFYGLQSWGFGYWDLEGLRVE